MVAGISVAMVMIPQAMAYAELAGLAPVFGLYAASLPPVVAAFFGSSRQLSTGPVAMAALISGATVAPLAPPASDAFLTYSITLALDQRIAILRFDGRLYFGDSGYFEEKVLEVVTRLPELRYLVIDAGSINQVDASGELTLRQVVERLRGADIDVFFTRAKPQFVDVLERTRAIEAIGRDHFFAWNQHALEYLWDQMEPTYRARCPLNVATPHVAAGTWNI